MSKEKRLSQKAKILLQKARSQYALCPIKGGKFLERAGTSELNAYDMRKIGREIRARLGHDSERVTKYGLLNKEDRNPKMPRGRILRILSLKRNADSYDMGSKKEEDLVRRYLCFCIAGGDYNNIGFLDKAKDNYEKGLNLLKRLDLTDDRFRRESGGVMYFLRNKIKEISEEQKTLGKQRFLRIEAHRYDYISMYKSCLKGY